MKLNPIVEEVLDRLAGRNRKATIQVQVFPEKVKYQAVMSLVKEGKVVRKSDEVDITSTGQSQECTFNIRWPRDPGTYKVYIDIFYAKTKIMGFEATERVKVEE